MTIFPTEFNGYTLASNIDFNMFAGAAKQESAAIGRIMMGQYQSLCESLCQAQSVNEATHQPQLYKASKT